MSTSNVVKGQALDRDSYVDYERDALKLWVVLSRSYNSFVQAEAMQLKRQDLTPPQFGILEALAHLGPMKMCTLGSKLLMSGANVTGVVDRLEQKGLVRRMVEADDRRSYIIHLTEEGGRVIADFFPSHIQTIMQLTGALSTEEKHQLTALLKKLGKTIQASLHP